MIHIKPNRCGYTGYTCTGVPKLAPAFKSLGLTCDYIMSRRDSWEFSVDLPIAHAKMEAYAVIMATADASMGSSFPAPWTWHIAALETLFPAGSSTTETLFARALCDWHRAYYAYGTGNTAAPYEVPGVDSVTVSQLLEALSHYIDAHRMWVAHGGAAADEPVFDTYVSEYMSASNFIDNYLNLPVRFRGFVTTWQPVYNMDTGYTLAAPEEECRNNFDPMTPDGFINLFSTYGSAVTARATDSSGSTAYAALESALVCFNDGFMEPGVIEPPLPVVQDTPSWPAVTQAEAGLDGASLGLVNMMQWRTVINQWLNDVARSLMHIWGLRALFMKMLESDISQNFTIAMSSGDVLTWDTETGTTSTPTFSVSAGTAYVNGVALNVSAASVSMGNDNVKYVWLNITLGSCDSATGQYGSVTASLGTARSGDISIGIGGIRKLTVVGTADGIPKYSVYQIMQERHTVALDLVRTCKEGVLYRMTSGASPYKVLEVTACPE